MSFDDFNSDIVHRGWVEMEPCRECGRKVRTRRDDDDFDEDGNAKWKPICISCQGQQESDE